MIDSLINKYDTDLLNINQTIELDEQKAKRDRLDACLIQTLLAKAFLLVEIIKDLKALNKTIKIKKLTWTKNVLDDDVASTPFGFYFIDQNAGVYEGLWLTGSKDSYKVS